jgi:hypothetical protein
VQHISVQIVGGQSLVVEPLAQVRQQMGVLSDYRPFDSSRAATQADDEPNRVCEGFKGRFPLIGR